MKVKFFPLKQRGFGLEIILIQFKYYLKIKFMATRAKYYRVKQEDNKEDKPDTDILMRFNPTYGTCPPTQAAMLPAH